MKKTLIEEKLENEELKRLTKLELLKSDQKVERTEVLNEIAKIHEMRQQLSEQRVDSNNSWIKTAIQTGIPVLATLCLAVFGFAAEASTGNPTGFTLRWLFNRAPR